MSNDSKKTTEQLDAPKKLPAITVEEIPAADLDDAAGGFLDFCNGSNNQVSVVKKPE